MSSETGTAKTYTTKQQAHRRRCSVECAAELNYHGTSADRMTSAQFATVAVGLPSSLVRTSVHRRYRSSSCDNTLPNAFGPARLTVANYFCSPLLGLYTQSAIVRILRCARRLRLFVLGASVSYPLPIARIQWANDIRYTSSPEYALGMANLHIDALEPITTNLATGYTLFRPWLAF